MNLIRCRSAILALALCALAGVVLAAPDYAREKRLADKVVASIAVGNALTLETRAGRRFLALLTAAAKPRAALVLVHGAGAHPDFGLVGKLRAGLADRGYTTLSIQMPVLAESANASEYSTLFAEAGQRLDAAIAYLRERGMNRIALVTHGMGARMANDYIARHPDARLMAWLPLSISTGRFQSLAGVRFPIFDIYAQEDLDAVRNGAPARAKVLHSHRGSKQAMVYRTNHHFGNKEREVAALIDQLLRPLAR